MGEIFINRLKMVDHKIKAKIKLLFYIQGSVTVSKNILRFPWKDNIER